MFVGKSPAGPLPVDTYQDTKLLVQGLVPLCELLVRAPYHACSESGQRYGFDFGWFRFGENDLQAGILVASTLFKILHPNLVSELFKHSIMLKTRPTLFVCTLEFMFGQMKTTSPTVVTGALATSLVTGSSRFQGPR